MTKRRTATKNNGTTANPSAVAATMPPKAPVPIAFWLHDPARNAESVGVVD